MVFMVVSLAAISFFCQRYYKLSQTGAHFNFSVEIPRIFVNFGMFVLLVPFVLWVAKKASNKLKRRIIIYPISFIVYYFLYLAGIKLIQFLLSGGQDVEIIRNVKKLTINFLHIATIIFTATLFVSSRMIKNRKKTTPQILLKTLKGEKLIVKQEDIIYIQSEDHYQKIFIEGDFFYVRMTMTGLSQKLDPDLFKRVHRSSIINTKKIKGIISGKNGDLHLKLSNDQMVKVSKTYKNEVKTYIKSFG